MSKLEIIALLANFMIVCGGSFFIIGIFGRNSKKMNDLPNIERWSIKIALSLTVSGAFFNLLNGINPSPSEALLDFGLGCIFIWAAHFHYKYFVSKKKQ
jgi:hypothetical protein